MDFARVLDEVADAFGREEIRFALAGGVAVAAYGVQRTTLDLDLVVARDQADAAVALLERLGFETLRRSAAFSSHLRAPSLERVDLILTDLGTAAAILERAERREVFDGTRVSIVHPEHLVAMKLHALAQNPSRRAIDLEDVRGLLLRGLVDPRRVSVYLERYGLETHRGTLGLDA